MLIVCDNFRNQMLEIQLHHLRAYTMSSQSSLSDLLDRLSSREEVTNNSNSHVNRDSHEGSRQSRTDHVDVDYLAVDSWTSDQAKGLAKAIFKLRMAIVDMEELNQRASAFFAKLIVSLRETHMVQVERVKLLLLFPL